MADIRQSGPIESKQKHSEHFENQIDSLPNRISTRENTFFVIIQSYVLNRPIHYQTGKQATDILIVDRNKYTSGQMYVLDNVK